MGVFTRTRSEGGAPIARSDIVRPLTAAASRVRINDRTEAERMKRRRGAAGWQQEAFAYYDAIGEIKYAFMLTGAVMSRMKLYLGWVESPGDPPGDLVHAPDLPEDYAQSAFRHFARLQSGHGGLPGLLRDFSLNLSVAGECYLLQEMPRPSSGIPERWTIRSVDEIDVGSDGSVALRESAAAGRNGLSPLSRDQFIGRIWRPHPRFHDDADSSMRGLLGLAEELLLLNRTVRATAKSRLNAGALFIPDGLSVAASPDVTDEDGATETEEDDAFEAELLAAMVTPIQDDDSASAVVPLLIRGPGELGSQIRQYKFERSFDSALVDRADRVLERIMQGIDVPKDVITGLANVKYSNAVQINNSLYRAHIEPLTLIMCDSLTTIFLRPALLAMGYPEEVVERTLVWYDPTDILTSADRASNANEGWDRYLISGQAWRSAHGFAESDAPTGEELLKRITVQRGQISPELVESVLQQIAPETAEAVREANIAGGPTGFPEGLQQLLEGGTGAGGNGEVPPEILAGLPVAGAPAAPAAAPAAPPPGPAAEEPPPEEELPPSAPGGAEGPVPDDLR